MDERVTAARSVLDGLSLQNLTCLFQAQQANMGTSTFGRGFMTDSILSRLQQVPMQTWKDVDAGAPPTKKRRSDEDAAVPTHTDNMQCNFSHLQWFSREMLDHILVDISITGTCGGSKGVVRRYNISGGMVLHNLVRLISMSGFCPRDTDPYTMKRGNYVFKGTKKQTAKLGVVATFGDSALAQRQDLDDWALPTQDMCPVEILVIEFKESHDVMSVEVNGWKIVDSDLTRDRLVPRCYTGTTRDGKELDENELLGYNCNLYCARFTKNMTENSKARFCTSDFCTPIAHKMAQNAVYPAQEKEI